MVIFQLAMLVYQRVRPRFSISGPMFVGQSRRTVRVGPTMTNFANEFARAPASISPDVSAY